MAMKLLRRAAALASSLSLAACGGASTEPARAPAAASGAVGAPAASAAAPAAPSLRYDGHGAASVDAAVLEQFRPKPLAPAVASRVQRYFDVRSVSKALTAPDGKALFVEWNVTGTGQVWRLDGPRRFPVQLTGGTETTTLDAVLPDGKALVVSRDRDGEENPGLYLLPAQGGALEVIQHTPGVQTRFGALSRDGKSVYFSANDQKKDAYALYRFDLATKQKELLYDAPGLWGILDVESDGRLLVGKATGGQSSEIYELDPKTKKLTPLLGQGEKELYMARYGEGPGDVIVLTDKLGEFFRLYVLRKGKLTPLGDEAKADVEPGFHVTRGATPRILYSLNEGGYSRLRALDARSGKALRVPEVPGAEQATWSDAPDSGRVAVVIAGDGRSPAGPWLVDNATGKPEAWTTPSSPELSRFVKAELEMYPARDGTKIPAFVRMPEACKSAVCPVLVQFHGGPESQARPGFAPTLQAFVDAGYIVVEPNVRGSSGYGKAWLHADDGPKRLAVVTDIEDAGKWARERFAVGGKAPKVGVMGGSYGGYSTLAAMTMFAGTFDAGVSNVGIANLHTFLANTAPYRRILRISEYGDPEKDREALEKLSPVTYVDRIKGPLFIIQGASDPRVPVGEAVQMFERIKTKGVPTDLMIFADEGHGAKKRDNRVLTLGHTVQFFDKHLKGGA